MCKLTDKTFVEALIERVPGNAALEYSEATLDAPARLRGYAVTAAGTTYRLRVGGAGYEGYIYRHGMVKRGYPEWIVLVDDMALADRLRDAIDTECQGPKYQAARRAAEKEHERRQQLARACAELGI